MQWDVLFHRVHRDLLLANGHVYYHARRNFRVKLERGRDIVLVIEIEESRQVFQGRCRGGGCWIRAVV